MSLLDIQPEILLSIVNRLSVSDQAAVARTCTQLRSLMFDPTLKRLQVARFQQRLALGRSVEPFLLQFVEEVTFDNALDASMLIAQFAAAAAAALPIVRLGRIVFQFSPGTAPSQMDWQMMLGNMARIPSLRSVVFRNCQLQPDCYGQFEAMHSIESLSFEGNLPVTDAIVPCLAATNIKTLNVHDARSWMSTGLASLGALKHLETLTLIGCCGVGDNLIDTGLHNLRVLRLDGCTQITDQGLQAIHQLQALEELSLVKCFYVSDIGLARIALLPKLWRLDVSQCFRITDIGLAHLSKMASLRDLAMRNCSRITSAGLFCLGSNRLRLVSIDISGCTELTEDSVAWLTHQLALPDMERLDSAELIPAELPSLFATSTTTPPATPRFANPASFSSSSPLRVIRMDGLRVVSARTLQAIASDAPYLTELRLSHCSQITDECLCIISQMHCLEILDLGCCVQVTDDGIQTVVASCPNLQQVVISWCELLSDRSLKAISSLRNLKLLDISGCVQLTLAGLCCLSPSSHFNKLHIERSSPRLVIGDGLGKI